MARITQLFLDFVNVEYTVEFSYQYMYIQYIYIERETLSAVDVNIWEHILMEERTQLPYWSAFPAQPPPRRGVRLSGEASIVRQAQLKVAGTNTIKHKHLLVLSTR